MQSRSRLLPPASQQLRHWGHDRLRQLPAGCGRPCRHCCYCCWLDCFLLLVQNCSARPAAAAAVYGPALQLLQMSAALLEARHQAPLDAGDNLQNIIRMVFSLACHYHHYLHRSRWSLRVQNGAKGGALSFCRGHCRGHLNQVGSLISSYLHPEHTPAEMAPHKPRQHRRLPVPAVLQLRRAAQQWRSCAEKVQPRRAAGQPRLQYQAQATSKPFPEQQPQQASRCASTS